MVRLLPALSYPDPTGNFNDAQVIGIALTSYLCALLFFLLFCFCIFNCWQYLYLQKKWKVFSLLMFYVGAETDLGLRVFVNI